MTKPREEPSRIFLAIPYRAGREDLVSAVTDAVKLSGHQLIRPDQQFGTNETIKKAIRGAISGASLVIGDITGANSNVMWELGYAQGFDKPLLLITRDPGSVPFDLESSRIVTYQASSPLSNLVVRLCDAISAMLPGSGVSPGERPSRPKGRNKVIFSYSHADAGYLDRMLVHLRPVERAGAIDLWSDTKLKAGDRWREKIRQAIGEARAAVLLISADFLASEFIATNELPPLLIAAESEGARIIPVIVKPSRFLRDDSLSRFQALNNPKLPLIRMNEADQEDLYAQLAEIIETEIVL